MPSPFEAARVRDLQQVVLDQSDSVIRAYDDKAHFLGMLKTGAQPSNEYAEWTADAPPNPVDGPVVEGADKDDSYGSYQARKLKNHSEEQRSKGWKVSTRAQAIHQKDVANEAAKQRLRDEENHVMGWEAKLLSNQDADDGSGNDSGITKTRCVGNWLLPVIGTSAYAANGGATVFAQRTLDPIPADIAVTPGQYYDGTLAKLDEATFKLICAAAANQVVGGIDLVMHAGMALKMQMTGWALNPTATVQANMVVTRFAMLDAMSKKLVTAVDWFQNDAGIVRSMLSFWVNRTLTDRTWQKTALSDASGYAINPKFWSINWLNPIQHFDPNKGNSKGGGLRGYHQSDGMLKPGTVQGQFAIVPNALA
jgi:hypothetical protein